MRQGSLPTAQMLLPMETTVCELGQQQYLKMSFAAEVAAECTPREAYCAPQYLIKDRQIS